MSRHAFTRFIVPLLVVSTILCLFLYTAYLGLFSPPFVSAVASSLLVLVTVASVLLTFTLLQERRDANKREVKPIIRIDVVPVSISTYNSIVENVGNGLAQDLSATLHLKPDGPKWSVYERNIRVDDKVPMFAPDNVEFQNSEYNKIELTGDVSDMFGEVYEIYDVYELENMDSNRGYLPYDNDSVDELSDIGKELSKIRRQLKDLGRTLSRMK